MKYFLTLSVLIFTAPAFAMDFDSFAKDNVLLLDLARAQNTITVLQTMPLLDLLAERDANSGIITLGETSFLATMVLDDNWDTYLQLKQKGSQANPGVWKEDALKAGVSFKYAGGEMKILEENGHIGLTDNKGNTAFTSSDELFDLLYTKSSAITFDGLVTYAVIRNFAPLSGNEGTITLRKGSDGLYYYSLTPDAQVAGYPRWLLAINGVLYGLKVTDTNAVFVSKPIEMKRSYFTSEKALR